jgi:hypothetical protein
VGYAFFDMRHSTTTCKSKYQQPVSAGCTAETEEYDGVILGSSPSTYPVGNGLPQLKYESISISYANTFTEWLKPPITKMPEPDCQIQEQDCPKQWRLMWNDLKKGQRSVFTSVDDDDNSYLARCVDSDEPFEKCVASWAEIQAIKTRHWFAGCSKPSYDQSEQKFCPYFGWYPKALESQYETNLDKTRTTPRGKTCAASQLARLP